MVETGELYACLIHNGHSGEHGVREFATQTQQAAGWGPEVGSGQGPGHP